MQANQELNYIISYFSPFAKRDFQHVQAIVCHDRTEERDGREEEVWKNL